MNGPSPSASAGRTRCALCSQIGLSSRTCLCTSLTNALPTPSVVFTSPMVRKRKLNRTTHLSRSIGVVTARFNVSTMPENDTSEIPGPHDVVSMRPSITPRGVGNFWLERIRDIGKPVSYDSSSGTVAVSCTNRKWAESTPFSAISCHVVSISYDVRMSVDQSGSSTNSGTIGTSHIGATDGSGWYHANDRPSPSNTG